MLEIIAAAITLGIVIVVVIVIDIAVLGVAGKISDKEYERLERPDLIRVDEEE